MKCKVNAEVLIVLTEGPIGEAEANQMVGRSNRAQGMGSGTVFVLTKVLEPSTNALDLFRAFDRSQIDDGYRNLKILMEKIDTNFITKENS